MLRRGWILTIGLLSLTVGAVACGPPDDPEPQRQEIDHDMVVDNLNANTRAMTRASSDSVRFVEDSQLVLDTADFNSVDCPNSPDPCDPQNTEPNIDTSLSEPTDRVLDDLERIIFSEANIVEQTSTQITYAPDAETMCDGASCATFDNGEHRCEFDQQPPSSGDIIAACRDNIREMNYRVKVWSPSEGTLTFSVEVGPGHNPGQLTLSEDSASVTTRLGEIKKAVAHADMVYDSDVAGELPDTFEGAVKGLLEKQGEDKMHAEARIESDVNIGGGDVQFNLASAGKPIFGATADGVTEKISATFNLPELEGSFPASYYHYDGQSEQEVTLKHTAHLAGLTGRLILDGSSESFKVEDLSLGDSTSWLKMAGERVLDLDLNADSGRSFSMTVESANAEDVFTADVSPEIDLSMALNFGKIQNQITWMEEWIKDDQFDLSLTGSNPSVRFGTAPDDTGFVEVVDGTMELSSATPDYNVTVSSGSCLMYQEMQSGGQVSYYHPLESYGSGSCPQ